MFISLFALMFGADCAECGVSHRFADGYRAKAGALFNLFVRTGFPDAGGQAYVSFPLRFPLNEQFLQACFKAQVFQKILGVKVLVNQKEQEVAIRFVNEVCVQASMPLVFDNTGVLAIQFEKCEQRRKCIVVGFPREPTSPSATHSGWRYRFPVQLIRPIGKKTGR
ncbi:MAG: hypothetical protein HY777_09740 [Betaproteobacteria bacterium]|nr:hypothetical protein [Betaproteobacteria bacterium]